MEDRNDWWPVRLTECCFLRSGAVAGSSAPRDTARMCPSKPTAPRNGADYPSHRTHRQQMDLALWNTSPLVRLGPACRPPAAALPGYPAEDSAPS